MRWNISRLSSSLMGLLRDPGRSTESQAQLEHIREKMLDSMSAFLEDADALPPVWTRVQYASDIQSLWYLRSDVMHMLCEHCGETLAAKRVHDLTALFRGHIPTAQFASARQPRG